MKKIALIFGKIFYRKKKPTIQPIEQIKISSAALPIGYIQAGEKLMLELQKSQQKSN